MIKLIFKVLIFVFFPGVVLSQTGSITNIAVSQRTDGSGYVDIYYDLAGPGSSYFISMEVSFNNGNTFTAVSTTFLSGNTGVTPDTNRHLIWNGQGSNNNTYSAQTKVKLFANITVLCGQPIIDPRDGKSYNTVQLGSHCWMAQNLNIGTKINGSVNQTNNGIIEKYCYNDLESNCDIYGGLFQWGELVQYLNGASNNTSWNPFPVGNVKGICPPGWHIPTDSEWCTLTQFLDPTVNCNIIGWSGIDLGIKMKSITGWYNNGNGTNASGFNVLPGGSNGNDIYWHLTIYAYFATSTQYSTTVAWDRNFYYGIGNIGRHNDYGKVGGFSVRCLYDY